LPCTENAASTDATQSTLPVFAECYFCVFQLFFFSVKPLIIITYYFFVTQFWFISHSKRNIDNHFLLPHITVFAGHLM
jgi:hypothetical protein